MKKAGEDGINRGSYPFVYFDPNDLNWQKTFIYTVKEQQKHFTAK